MEQGNGINRRDSRRERKRSKNQRAQRVPAGHPSRAVLPQPSKAVGQLPEGKQYAAEEGPSLRVGRWWKGIANSEMG